MKAQKSMKGHHVTRNLMNNWAPSRDESIVVYNQESGKVSRNSNSKNWFVEKGLLPKEIDEKFGNVFEEHFPELVAALESCKDNSYVEKESKKYKALRLFIYGQCIRQCERSGVGKPVIDGYGMEQFLKDCIDQSASSSLIAYLNSSSRLEVFEIYKEDIWLPESGIFVVPLPLRNSRFLDTIALPLSPKIVIAQVPNDWDGSLSRTINFSALSVMSSGNNRFIVPPNITELTDSEIKDAFNERVEESSKLFALCREVNELNATLSCLEQGIILPRYYEDEVRRFNKMHN